MNENSLDFFFCFLSVQGISASSGGIWPWWWKKSYLRLCLTYWILSDWTGYICLTPCPCLWWTAGTIKKSPRGCFPLVVNDGDGWSSGVLQGGGMLHKSCPFVWATTGQLQPPDISCPVSGDGDDVLIIRCIPITFNLKAFKYKVEFQDQVTFSSSLAILVLV